MITFREFQHFLYCPHRWARLFLMDGWKENVFTVLSEIKHERIHMDKALQKTSKKIVFGSVMLYSNSLEIYGKTDALEFVKNEKGVFVQELGSKFDINIIEYKPTQPKTVSKEDRVQVYAQYVCAKELFDCEPTAYIYYMDVRRRIRLEFDEEDEKQLHLLINKITKAKETNLIPRPEKGKKCNGCSLKDDCMPNVTNTNVRKIILEEL